MTFLVLDFDCHFVCAATAGYLLSIQHAVLSFQCLIFRSQASKFVFELIDLGFLSVSCGLSSDTVF